MAGPQCCENPPTLNSSFGAGLVAQLGGLKTYISGSLDSKKAILLVTDVYGYEAPILRKLADKVAAAGFYVVAPDFLHGDPYVPDNPEKPLPIWLQEHGADKAAAEAKPVIEAIKSKGISAIGTAGFCWGGKVVAHLAKTDDLKAVVFLHPSFVTVEDIKEINIPVSVLGAEIDQRTPPELVKQFEEVLSTKSEVDGFVKIFPGVKHGWSVRYNVEDEVAVKFAEEAQNDMLAWFVKHVK